MVDTNILTNFLGLYVVLMLVQKFSLNENPFTKRRLTMFFVALAIIVGLPYIVSPIISYWVSFFIVVLLAVEVISLSLPNF